MSECRRIRELLGGHALGALEPDEAEHVRGHLARCPHCAREHGSLVEAAALLELLEPTDVPLAAPSPELEQALLDRHARARRRVSAAPPPASRPRGLGAAAARRGAWARKAPLLGAAAAAAAVVATVAVMTGSGVRPPAPSAEGGVRLTASAAAPGATGRAELRPVSGGTGVRLALEGLDRRPDAVYTLWCVRDDGAWVSGGSFRPDARGRANASLTAGVRRGEYERVLVTRSRSRGSARERRTVLAGRVEYE